jgi:hypothetical protein
MVVVSMVVSMVVSVNGSFTQPDATQAVNNIAA